MAPTVAFRRKFPWAIPPERERIATDDLKDYAATAEREFRWHRAGRVPELCWPWRLAAELGWVIRCPVDLRMEPFRDFEVGAGPEHRAGLDDILRDYDLWMHHATPLAVSKPESRWMKLHDFQSEHGWQSMFIPNGRGTVEWHLGWDCDWPADAFALFLPYRFGGPLEVIPGILDARHLAAAGAKLGVSMAVKPVAECELRRGDPIARLVLLHADSLKAR
ncbi:MAG: hypothetical protein IT436_08660 [Phycisphaerales bacterium]|nr:hypothetical protein [Phycisphaerales bacterium]